MNNYDFERITLTQDDFNFFQTITGATNPDELYNLADDLIAEFYDIGQEDYE